MIDFDATWDRMPETPISLVEVLGLDPGDDQARNAGRIVAFGRHEEYLVMREMCDEWFTVGLDADQVRTLIEFLSHCRDRMIRPEET